MSFTVAMEKSELTPQQFMQVVNVGAQHVLASLAEFTEHDAMPQLVILEIAKRHLMQVVESGLAMDPLGLAKFRRDLEEQFAKLKMVGVS